MTYRIIICTIFIFYMKVSSIPNKLRVLLDMHFLTLSNIAIDLCFTAPDIDGRFPIRVPALLAPRNATPLSAFFTNRYLGSFRPPRCPVSASN
jgi:hypothetical protein